MKWIITGGAGFIGCHAAARFHEAGHHVVVVDNLSRPGADIRKAERALGWKPTVATPAGVDRLLSWIHGNPGLFQASGR